MGREARERCFMMKKTVAIAALALAASAMFAESALAKNIAVGPLTCRVTITGVNRFATIQAAVNAAVANDVIYVCPGNYPEQVVINKALTIRGESDGVGNLAVITVPAGGLTKNVDSATPTSEPGLPPYGAIAAQVLAQDTSFVKLLNFAVDGTLPPGLCAEVRSAGIVFLNVGAAGTTGPSAGSISNVVVRDHANPCLDISGQAERGVGILLENSYIAVADSTVHTVRGDGIRQHGGIADISRNFLMDVWDYSVRISAATASDVRTNTIIHSAHGVVVQSDGVDVVSNTIGPYVGEGIFLAGATNTLVTSNKMVHTTSGIRVNESSGAQVTGNIVYRTGTGILDLFSGSDNGLPPNVIKTNEVNEANIGMCTFSAGTDTVTANTFTNVAILTTTCP
jgi:parallel beta-helix repeat protein